MTGPPILEVIEFHLLLPSTASPSSFQSYNEIRLPSILSEPHGPHPSPVKETQSRIAGTAKQVCFLFWMSVYICVFLTSFRLRRNPAREKRIILTFPHTFPVLHNVFEDAVGYNSHMIGDGVSLPTIQTLDNSACVELLRGAQLSEKVSRKPGGILGVMSKASSSYKSGKAGDKKDDDMLQDLVAKFGVHASFMASPNVGGTADRNLFGINHYAGNCSYDVTGFVEKNNDMLDSAFVSLLRNSSDTFVSKLLSGPSLAAEKHSKDESIVVQAQVSSRPLRQPTSIISPDGALSAADSEPSQLDSSKVYPITTQLNHTLSTILAGLDRTHLWTISCIRPNDSGSPNSFDKRRVKAQIRSLLLPELVARRSTEYIADHELAKFCDRYVP